jgi:hypothetical protein
MRTHEKSQGEHESADAAGLTDLARILAGGLLRIARHVAVSDATNPVDRLDVFARSRPHLDDNEAA